LSEAAENLALVVVIQAMFLVAVVVLREPKLLIPCVVLGLPFEYASTQTLGSLGEGGAGGAIRTLLNPGKAAMLATIVVGVFRLRHTPLRMFPNSMMVLPLFALLAVVVLGVYWSDSQSPSNAVLIMPMYVAFVCIAPSLIEDRRDLERIVAAFLLATMGLAVVAFAQRLGGVFQWRSILIQSDDYSYRANAFFADPNNLARFFAISLSLAAGLILATGPRRLTVHLAAPALALGLPAIVLTASRSGWLGLLIAGFLVVLFSPIRRYTKVRLSTLAFGGVTAALVLLFLQGGADAERVRSLTSGVEVIGQRSFLIRGGWEMWKDNPLVGVGSGNYQHTLVVSYLWTIPYWAETTLSHTSFISILAELGIVGLGILVLFFFRLFLTCVRSYFATADHYTRLLVGWVGAAFVEILFQSQSEGRLLEEPFLYLLIAILISLELGAGLKGNDPVVARDRARPEAAHAPALATPPRRRTPGGVPSGKPVGEPGGG
jgi:putative inorganic carbon (HCO3(-)) transporter